MKKLIENLKPLNQTNNIQNYYAILDYIIRTYDLKFLIQDLKFYNQNNNIYGYYDPENLEINININPDIYLKSFLEIKDEFNYYDLTEYKNASIILSILHESRHAYQTLIDMKRVYYKNDDIYSNIVKDFIALNDDEYNSIYDTNPLEKDAEISAYESLIHILPYMTNNKRIINFFIKDYYNYKIKEGYINNSFLKGSLEINYKTILNNYDRYISLKPKLIKLSPFNKIKLNEELNTNDLEIVYEEKNKNLIKNKA